VQRAQLLQHARCPVFYSWIGILVYKRPIFFPIAIPYVNCLRFIVLQVIFIMSIRRIACLVILVFFNVTLGTMASSQAVPPPLPVLPIPNARQLKWQQREMTMFFHFGMNTFTDREWGDGQEDPQLFDPKALNATQWAAVAKEAGFSLVILTAKHHDGFCLWQTAYTNHSVRDSPWEDGKGDIVKDLAKAAQAVGLDFGVYLSPWDRHEPTYGLELQYNEFYLGQLQELLTKYGQISEVWFDGAKGKNATKMNYMFTTWFEMVHELQISANIFSDAGPDVRWVGDEAGAAGLTSWSTINGSALKIGDADIEGYLNTGDPYGTDWIPAECDVSIRAGWFWHKSKKPRPLSKLLNIYYHSVGRNCLLLLNVPPNTSGLISAEDATRLLQLKKAIKTIFSKDLAAFATVTASSVRGGYNSGPFAPVNVLNDDVWSYWAPAEQNGGAYWVELMAKETMEFNVVRIQEAIGLGQRVMKYSVFARMAEFETGVLVAHGSTIGYKRLHRLDAHVKATSVRLLVEECRGGIPLISSFGLHLDPFYHPKNRSL